MFRQSSASTCVIPRWSYKPSACFIENKLRMLTRGIFQCDNLRKYFAVKPCQPMDESSQRSVVLSFPFVFSTRCFGLKRIPGSDWETWEGVTSSSYAFKAGPQCKRYGQRSEFCYFTKVKTKACILLTEFSLFLLPVCYSIIKIGYQPLNYNCLYLRCNTCPVSYSPIFGQFLWVIKRGLTAFQTE